MREYFAERYDNARGWSHIPVAPIDNLQWSPAVDIAAQAQLSWDGSALYVRMCAKEKDIRAEGRGLLQPVCEDSCLEFFFGFGDGRYFNFELNPNKALYLGFGDDGDFRVRLILRNEESQLDPDVILTDDGWCITYKIPVELIRQFYPDFWLHEGLKFYGNFYKCGDKTSVPHYFSWNRVDAENPDFHRPADFGMIILR